MSAILQLRIKNLMIIHEGHNSDNSHSQILFFAKMFQEYYLVCSS